MDKTQEESRQTPQGLRLRLTSFVTIAALLILITTTGGISLLEYYHRQKPLVELRYKRNLLALSGQTQEVTEKVLNEFAIKSHQPNLPKFVILKGVDESSINVADGTDSIDQSTDCPLHLTGGKLTYDFHSFTQNTRGGWENWSMKLSANLGQRIKDSVTAGIFKTLVIADGKGVSLFPPGSTPLTRPEIISLIHEAEKQQEDKTGGSNEFSTDLVDEPYTVFHHEIILADLGQAQNLLETENNCSLSLHIFGLATRAQMQKEILQLPQDHLLVLFLALFLSILSFPFFKLFTAPRERFRRSDSILLVICEGLLVAAAIFFVTFGSSLKSIEEQYDRSLTKMAKVLASQKGNLGRSSLSPGASFIVVDPQGNVLVHQGSLQTDIQDESTESDGNNQLRRELQHPSERPFNALIEGRPQRLLISSIPQREEKLVILLDSEPLRSIRYYTLLTALLATALLLVFFIIITLIQILSGVPLSVASFWPRHDGTSRYRKLTLTYLLAGLLSLIAILLSSSSAAVLIAILVSTSIFCWTLWFLSSLPREAPPAQPAPSARLWFRYSATVLLFLLLCVGLPTWAVGRSAFQRETQWLAIFLDPNLTNGQHGHQSSGWFNDFYDDLRYLDDAYTKFTPKPLDSLSTGGKPKMSWLILLLLELAIIFALTHVTVIRLFNGKFAPDALEKDSSHKPQVSNDPQEENIRLLLSGNLDEKWEKIWQNLTPEQKWICRQVADQGPFRLGPDSFTLFQCKLLLSDPVPRIADQRFRFFIRQEPSGDKENSVNLWSWISRIALLCLAIALGFLFLTQEESFKGLSIMISAVGGMLVALRSLVNPMLSAKPKTSSD